MDYRGKVALVTGASSGIGHDLCRCLAERGCQVVAVARREERLKALLEICQQNAPTSSYLAGDLGERDFAERCVGETLERHGRLDLLVNNAAMPMHKSIYDLSADEAERVMKVNFLSCVWTTLAAIPAMLKQRGGTIVNVSSMAALVAPPRESIYAASKSAMEGFSQGLWNDLAGSGIHVAIVRPGAIDTEIWRKLDEPPAFRGRKHPARIVSEAVLKAIEKRRFEITVPGRSPSLLAARALRIFCPALLRAGLARMDPVPEEVIARARDLGDRPNS